MQRAIDGGRYKWATPKTISKIDKETPALTAAPLGNFKFSDIPPHHWVLGHRLIKDFVIVTIAPGGIGKSIFTMEEAVAIATSNPITGDVIHTTGNVWICNNEDPP